VRWCDPARNFQLELRQSRETSFVPNHWQQPLVVCLQLFISPPRFAQVTKAQSGESISKALVTNLIAGEECIVTPRIFDQQSSVLHGHDELRGFKCCCLR